jgi:DNA adenine methylase
MAKPLVKYPGGKRDHVVLEQLSKLAQEIYFDTYISPTCGGAADFFALQERGLLTDKTVILGDADADLIQLYAAVLKNHHAVYKRARDEADHIALLTEKGKGKYYHSIRSLWNLGERNPGVQLFLRHACWNGLFRRNQKGELNTPARDLDNLSIPSIGELADAAAAFEGVELVDWDFRQYEEDDDVFVGPGVLMYVDPPYDGKNGFRQYVAGGFTVDDQRDLIEHCATWSRRGATIVYSNADTALINQLLSDAWPEATVEHVHADWTISSDVKTRGLKPEVIAHVS